MSISTANPLHSRQVNTLPAAPQSHVDGSGPAVSPSTDTSFAAAQLSGTAGTAGANSTPTINARPGAGPFDKATFHPEFRSAFTAAKNAWDSQENINSLNATGRPSVAAQQACNKLDDLMFTHVNPRLDSASHMFGASPEEADAWKAFRFERGLSTTAPTVPANAPTKWKSVSPQELQGVMVKDPAFSKYMKENPVEANKWVGQLAQAINQRSAQVRGDASPDEKLATLNGKPTMSKSEDNGVALIFRFESTYNTATHIALGTLYRDENGALQMNIAHQESVPKTQESVPKAHEYKTTTGQVFNTLDTSAQYPGGLAPVYESMKLAGLPAVNVWTCPNPEGAGEITQSLSGSDPSVVHPYGASNLPGGWKSPKTDKLEHQRYENCFDVTHKVLANAFNLKQIPVETFPHIIRAMQPFASIKDSELSGIDIGKDKLGNNRPKATIDNLPVESIVRGFMHVAGTWGRNEDNDVNASYAIKMRTMSVKPGVTTGLEIPPGAHAVKFANNNKFAGTVMLDGKPVIVENGDRTFTPEEAKRLVITFTPTTETPKATLTLIDSFPKSTGPAKL